MTVGHGRLGRLREWYLPFIKENSAKNTLLRMALLGTSSQSTGRRQPKAIIIPWFRGLPMVENPDQLAYILILRS